MRLAVFASGSGSNFEAITNAFSKDESVEVVLLVTDKECFALERARRLVVKTFTLDKSKKRSLYEEDVLCILKKERVDYIALAGYMNIIGSTLLSEYGGRIVNIHPSLLPKYRGLRAIERAYENLDSEIGVSIHYVDKGIDTGEIIAQDKLLRGDSSLEEVIERIHELEHRLYVNTLKGLMK